MRLDDDPSDGPELVLREAPAAIDAPHRGGRGMLTGVVMLILLPPVPPSPRDSARCRRSTRATTSCGR